MGRAGGGLLAAAVAAGLLGVGASVLVTGHLGALGASGGTPPAVEGRLSLGEALGGGTGFARAAAPRAFRFPDDHGPHPGYRTEWWYVTGNVATAGRRALGFQVTFFRTAMAAAPAPRRSAWATRDVYLAHLAVTDVAGGRFHQRERVARDALGLSGARAAPFRVWLGDWMLEGQGPAGFPARLRAGDEAAGLDLELSSTKPPVLHGEAGWSRKSVEPGNASYYYSLTRLSARGTVRVGGAALEVEGLAWLDREWSTSALGIEQVGWDWFGLQLSDGRELMLYRLRRADGGVDPLSDATLVDAGGGARRIPLAAVRVTVLDQWRSPRGGARYPARWRIEIADEALDLMVTPVLSDQELDLAVRYWEGAVRAVGRAGSQPVAGVGYVELVGYETGERAGPGRAGR